VREVLAIAADATLTNEDMGKIVTNRGASGAVVITLPSASGENAGGSVEVHVVANQSLRVQAATNDKMVLINDAAGDYVEWSTGNEKIGGGGLFVSDGTNWLFSAMNAGANTVTTST
jgi:hypothetical protein